MARVIDDKIVAMSFESSKFESGVNNTLSALDKLKASLKFPNAGKGMEDIQAASKKLDFGHVGKALDDIKGRLSAFRLIAIATLASIAQKAISAGTRFGKAFTIDPLKAGFAEYTTNLNAIQTILANTQAAGTTLKDVNATLKELNDYSDKTIYNFAQMAKNIGTFTAAGVELDVATGAIKGIANLAALSGSNAEQAATAMYQLSQAISAGSVKLQDWNSVVNAGMGGTVFQRALAQTAEAVGTLEKGAVKLEGPMKTVTIAGEAFRQSLSTPGKASWLTSEVLTKTLKQFTGDLTDAELAAQGFNAEQIKAIQQTAKTAMFAATEVKTLAQVIDVAKETAGSGWAQTWQIIFGDFAEAKKTFTALSEAINGFINASSDSRNKVLGDWKALGGRTVLINAIKIAFQNLGEILKPIREAFREFFPARTGKDVYDLTLRIKELAEAMKPSPETIDNLKRTFRGLFAVMNIGKQVIGGILGLFGRLVGSTGAGSGGFLSFTANIGDFLVALDKMLTKGNVLNKFFDRLGNILEVPIELLGRLKDAISNLFTGFSPGVFSDEMNLMTQAMTPFERVLNAIGNAWTRLTENIDGSDDILRPAFDAIIGFIQKIGPAIGQAASSMNFEAILAVIRTGLFAALVLMFKRFFGKGSFLEQIGGARGGFLGNISGLFGQLTGSMKALQTNIKADTLKKIAISIALLTASVVALSFVDPERLKSSLTAMAVAFGQLLAAMAILEKVSTAGGFIKLPFITASLILLAGAINLLTISVFALSRLSWEELAKGLGGIGVLLGAISVAVIPMSASSAGMVRAGIGITAIAVAMKILASAVTDFGKLSWTEISKGLGAVVVLLGAISVSMKTMPKSMVLTGAGLVVVATALNILAKAVEKFASMNLRDMGKGLLGIAAGLVIIAAAMHLMPKFMIASAAGLVLVSIALKGIAKAVESMGRMSIKEIAKGLTTLAGSLTILAISLHAMKGTLSGSAALAVAAAGLALLAPALVKLGKMSWPQIIKSMVTLAVAMTALGVAGLLIGPVVPALLGLGAALVLVGGGLALAGAGIFLISAGLSALAISGTAGIAVLVAALVEASKAIPDIVKNLVLGLLEMVKAFAKTAPEFVKALGKILVMLLEVIIRAAPKIGQAFGALLKAGLKVLAENQDDLVKAGLSFIISLLKGIRNNIGQIVKVATDIIVEFLKSIANNIGRVLRAGTEILTSLLKGIANSIGLVVSAAANIVIKFLDGIANNLSKVAAAGLNILTRFLKAISDNIIKVIDAGTSVIVNFLKGMSNAGDRIVTEATNVIITFAKTLSRNAVRLADEGAKAIIAFLNGIADVIEKREPEMIKAGARIGIAIVKGMIQGLKDMAPELLKQAGKLIKSLPGAFIKKLGIKSPSKVFREIGQFLIMGLAQGMQDDTNVIKAAETMSLGIINAVKTIFKITSPSKVMQDLGKFIVQGFALGIRGTSAEVKEAFGELTEQFNTTLVRLRQDLETENEKLARLSNAKIIDYKEMNKQTEVVRNIVSEIGRVTEARKIWNNSLDDERSRLSRLSVEYEKLGIRLEKAKDVLADAKRTREEAIRSFTDQYSTLPDIVTEDAEGNSIDALATYMQALKNQADAVTAYQSTLQQLRKLGLDDATYQKLLREGPENQRFADQLLAGGKTAVNSLNVLDKQLLKVSTTLATNAANNLYKAGIDAAQGLVKGLEAKRSDIRKAMEAIAREMIGAIKKELKIKSPSRAFAEIGVLSMEGLARGFNQSSKIVSDAIVSASDNALESFRKSMSNISNIVTDEINPSPIITPVLDLTKVRTQAEEMAKLTQKTPLVASASLGQATAISTMQSAQAETEMSETSEPTIKFEQNNYSPDTLSEVEIYRRTRNQLSQFKTVLANT